MQRVHDRGPAAPRRAQARNAGTARGDLTFREEPRARFHR
jgi:hypothetical protein